MANWTLQRLMVLSRAVCVALAIILVAVAMAVPTKHKVGASQFSNCLMGVKLKRYQCSCVWPMPPAQGHQLGTSHSSSAPQSTGYVLACFTLGTACAGLAVAHTFISRRACALTACAMYMSVAIIACLVGLLGCFSSLATLWIVAPRFQQQPQPA